VNEPLVDRQEHRWVRFTDAAATPNMLGFINPR